jgi:hypothetical protein
LRNEAKKLADLHAAPPKSDSFTELYSVTHDCLKGHHFEIFFVLGIACSIFENVWGLPIQRAATGFISTAGL